MLCQLGPSLMLWFAKAYDCHRERTGVQIGVEKPRSILAPTFSPALFLHICDFS